MIKAKAADLVVYGLSKENIDRLVRGEPILFGNEWEDRPGKTLIVYGTTEQEILDGLKDVGAILPTQAGSN